MNDKLHRPVKIKRKFYRMAALTLSVIVLMTILGIMMLMREQSAITEDYEEITEKYTAINELEDDLTQVLFRARGYYAFQEQRELDELNANLERLNRSIVSFQSLTLTEEEEDLIDILSAFYTTYTNDILPVAIGFVENDDYESLRALSSGGTNDDINLFLDYTREFNDETQLERDTIYGEAMRLFDQFAIGFILLGVFSAVLLGIMISRLLKEIINPLGILIAATNDLREGRKLNLKSDYQLEELSVLAESFSEMAIEVQDKEDELTAQNEELISQQDELEYNQGKMEEYLTEIETINKALNQSALLCITDEKGIIRQVNDMFCRISQYEAHELIGSTTRILKSGHQSEGFYEQMWQTIQKGKLWTGKMKNEAKNGDHYWINTTIVPFLDTNGRAYRYILIGIDITDNERNEHALKELLTQTQKAQEKTENYSNLNKELTATVDREEFLQGVFQYFNGAIEFDKGILISLNHRQYAVKGLTDTQAQQFLTDDYSKESVQRLKAEKLFVIKREATSSETGIAEESVMSYDLYASVPDSSGNVDLVFAVTRIGHAFSKDETSEIAVLMTQLSIALSRIDIYEEVQRERSINESIVQNVTEGLQLVSLEGTLLQANDKLLEMLDIHQHTISQSTERKQWMREFTANYQENKEVTAFYNQAIDPDHIELSSIRCQLKSETERYIQIYSSAVFIDGAKTGTIFMYRDITKEYEVDAMKSELVSTVSHELRTPLSSVLGFTEMLLMKDLKPEKQKKYLETIFKEAKRLTNLINDFLDVQRIESGRLEYDMNEINLNEIIMEVIDTFRHEKKHPIYLEDSAAVTTVLGDKDRLIQLLTNLISNAVKFSPEGGKVAVRISNSDHRIVVSIKDSGIGIPEAEIINIFTKFKRIDNSASKKIGGTGLGLAISKGIVEAHQGDIWINSRENSGTTVLFSLPVIQKETKTSETAGNNQIAFETRGNVMLVEDDISLATLLSESLKSHGFNVIHYWSSESVAEVAREQKLVGIVIDLVLEDGNTGWELIRSLKSNQTTKQIPVIISSAIDKTADAMETYVIHEYLVKPYSPDILSEIMIDLAENQLK